MKRQTNDGFQSRLRMGAWMACWAVALLPLAFEGRAADALRADAIGMGGTDLLAVLSDSGGQVVSMGNTLSPEPEPIAGVTAAIMVDGSAGGKLVLKSDGTLFTLTQVGAQLVAAQVAGIDNVVSIAPAQSHFVALKNDGTVWVWGDGTWGQLGNGPQGYQATPIQVPNLDNAMAIGSSWASTYAVKTDGSVWCTRYEAPFVARIQGLDNAIAVSGGSHALFLKSDGTLMAWGQNKYGQLGDGTTIDRSEPVAVVGLRDVIAVSAGKWHSLALKSDGNVWAWGENLNRECGVPYRNPDPASPMKYYEPLPVQVPISNVSAISADRRVSGALKTDRTVWIWGAPVSNTYRDPYYGDLQAPTQVLYGASGNRAPFLVSSAWAEPNSVTLPAGASVHVAASDPDGDALTYAWSQVSGAGAATFTAPAAADSGVTFSAAGNYTLRVTISDGNGGGVSSDVTITVQGAGGSGPGDLNGDRSVNIADILLLIENWGKTPSDVGYDGRADANGDGLVNITDLIVVSSNFGKTY